MTSHPADTGPGIPNFRISATEVLSYAAAFLTDDAGTFPGISPANRSAYVLRAAAIHLATFQSEYIDVGTTEPVDSPLHPQRWQIAGTPVTTAPPATTTAAPMTTTGTTSPGGMVAIAPSKDNTLYENAGGLLSNGLGSYVFTGRSAQTPGNSIRRALLTFDITGSIPAGSTVTSAILTMNMSRTPNTTGRIVGLRRVSVDWGEGTSDAAGQEGSGGPASPGDATWIHTFYPTTTWSTAGGDFAGLESASRNIGGLGQYSWGSTAQMTADVQSWLDSPAGNFGWILVGDETTGSTSKRFDSLQNQNAPNRPALIVEFLPP